MVTRALILTLLSFASVASANDACTNVTCSGHGRCFEEREIASCLCEVGYVAVGTACTEGGDEDAVMRARRDPGAGYRVRDIATNEVGRRIHQVGAGFDRPPHELSQYLMPNEWWCGDFVSWVYAAAGVPFTGGSAGGWLIPNNIAIAHWFDARDLWIDREDPRWGSHLPRPGDFVRIHTDLGGHAAIVHHVEGDTLYAVEGNVWGHVELERYYHFRTNRLIHGFGVFALPNAPPQVSAGHDTRLRFPERASLASTITDDGPESALEITWSLRTGPGEVTFSEPNSARTECTFTVPGEHVVRLEVSDGEHTAFDEITIDARRNTPPIVRAWLDTLDDGRATVDGSAADDSSIALTWSQVSGPGEATFRAPNEHETDVTFTEPGVYVLRLTASDGELTAEHDLTLDVPSSTLGCGVSQRGSGLPMPILALLVTLLGIRRTRRIRCRC
jgi:hypothetical protein